MGRTSLPALVSQLLRDGVEVAKAEVGLQKARVTAKLTAAKAAIILIAAAAIVALLALIGFVLGMVMALATLVGPGLAGLIVLAVGGAIAGLLGWLGAQRLSGPPVAVAEAQA